MFGLVVRFDLKQELAHDFDRLAFETLKQIHDNEPRTLLYVTHKVEDDPNARVFYEIYVDRAAFDEHEEQPHTKRFLAEREQYFSAPPRVEFFTSVDGKGLPVVQQ